MKIELLLRRALATIAGVLLSAAMAHAAKPAELGPTLQLVRDAYGGRKLENLKALRIEDTVLETYEGQGFTPDYVDFWQVRRRYTLDLKNGFGSDERWGDQYGSILHQGRISNASGRFDIDYHMNTFTRTDNTDLYTDFGAMVRISDTLLAREVLQRGDSASYNGTVNYLGRPHHHVSMDFPGSPLLHLYIDADSGFIHRMSRTMDDGVSLFYVFENHQHRKGLTFASQYRFFVGADLIGMVTDRMIWPNKLVKADFRVASHLTVEPERYAVDAMRVTALSDKVYQAGFEEFSVFVDAGDYWIGMGGYQGLKDRYLALVEKLGRRKPLRYQIASHHHSDHTAGFADALELGATLVVPEALQKNIQAQFPNVTADRLKTFSGHTMLGDVHLYTVSTSHSQVNTLAYIPAIKAVFQADHYAGFFKEQANPPTRASYSMKTAIDALGLDVDRILSAHSGKVENWEDFAASMASYKSSRCPAQRAICADQ